MDGDPGFVDVEEYIADLEAQVECLREQAAAAIDAASIAHGQRDEAVAAWEALKVERATCCAANEAEVARLRALVTSLVEYDDAVDMCDLCDKLDGADAPHDPECPWRWIRDAKKEE